jgi:hypothetical protein
MKTLATFAKAYAVAGIATVIFYNAILGPGDIGFNAGLALTWPLFWAMGLIFVLAALAA